MDNFVSPIWIFEKELPSQICDYIIKVADRNEYSRGTAGDDTLADRMKRDTDVQFSEERWLNGIFFSYALRANGANWNYDMSTVDHECMQVCKYNEGQFYKEHTDYCGIRGRCDHTRKLSVSTQISKEEDYQGGELELDLKPVGGEGWWTAPKSRGTIVVFDSRILHRVNPVTSGLRYSVQKWVHGDKPLR